MLFSNNDVILQSEGVKKGQKIAVILNVWPLTKNVNVPGRQVHKIQLVDDNSFSLLG